MKFQYCIGILFSLSFLVNCSTNSVDPGYEALVETASSFPTSGELGIGDKFSIAVFGEKELSGSYVVDEDGAITFPFLGRVPVESMTCTEVEITLIKGLVGTYLKYPNIRCSIEEYVSKRVYVFGEFKKPGSIPYRTQMSVVEAVAAAEGFSSDARYNQLKLTRASGTGDSIHVTVPINEIIEGQRPNFRLLPGDILFVPTRLY